MRNKIACFILAAATWAACALPTLATPCGVPGIATAFLSDTTALSVADSLTASAFSPEEDARIEAAVKALNAVIQRNTQLIALGRNEELEFVVDMDAITFGEAKARLTVNERADLNKKLRAIYNVAKLNLYLLISLPYAPKFIDARLQSQEELKQAMKQYDDAIDKQLKLIQGKGLGVVLNIDSYLSPDQLKINQSGRNVSVSLTYSARVLLGSKISIDEASRIGLAFSENNVADTKENASSVDYNTGKEQYPKSPWGFVNYTFLQTDRAINAFLTVLRLVDDSKPLDQITDPNELELRLISMLPQGYERLTLSQRLRILRILTGSRNRCFDNCEKIVVNVVKKTPNTDYSGLLAGLDTPNTEDNDNAKLIACIVDKVNDAFLGQIGGDNYAALMREVNKIWANNNKAVLDAAFKSADPSIYERVVLVSAFGTEDLQLENAEVNEKNGTVTIQLLANLVSIPKNLPSLNVSLTTTEIKDAIGPLKPFDWVIMVFNDKRLQLVYEAEPTALSNKIYVVPAIFMKFAADKKRNNQISTAVGIAGDIVAIYSGGGILVGAGKAAFRWRYAWRWAELLGGVGNIAANVAANDLPPQAQEALGYFNTAMGVVGGMELVQVLATKQGAAIRAVVNRFAASNKKLTPAQVANFVEAVDKVKPALIEAANKGNKQAVVLLEAAEDMKVAATAGRAAASASGAAARVALLKPGTASTLSASATESLTKLAQERGLLVDANNVLQTPERFLKQVATGNSKIYEVFLDDGLYVKYDLDNGLMLLTSQDGSKLYAYAIDRRAPTALLTAATPAEYNAQLLQFIAKAAEDIKPYIGFKPGTTITSAFNNLPYTVDPAVVNTAVGRGEDITDLIRKKIGDYKNTGLGEAPGSINFLNFPEEQFIPTTWWQRVNKPWIQRAIARKDKIVVMSEISEGNLFRNVKIKDFSKPNFFAYELKMLADADVKPVNLTIEEWNRAKEVINKFTYGDL